MAKAKKTVKLLLDELSEQQHRIAVWQKVSEMLSELMDQDDVKAQKSLRSSEGALEGIVPQSIIQSILIEISEGPLSEAKAIIIEIQEAEVV